jgi:hypothetical protein
MKRMFLLAPMIVIASCAPSYNPQGTRLDAELSCTEISQQIVKAQSVRTEAQGNKGVSGQNIAWALLFWPAIFLNENNNNQVIQKIDERVDNLNRLYTGKGCATTTVPVPATITPIVPAGK